MTSPDTPSKTILLVDDEPAVRRLVAAALQRVGYEVLEAHGGAHALELFDARGGSVDLVITDVRMPVMDGQELVRLLRERAPALRVLCVSGYPGGAGIDATLTEHYLAKPFTRADLLAKVRAVLGATAYQ